MSKKIEFLYFALWFIVICILWSRMFYFDGTYYWAGWESIWADWTLHIPYILNFAYRSFPLLTHPQLAGEPFRYHFAADMISGLLMKSGLSLVSAIVIPSIICMTLLIIALYIFFFWMLKNKIAAIIASTLFLFNGGLGIFQFLYVHIYQGIPVAAGPPLSMLTRNDAWGFRWMNFFLAEFIPQRAFLLGAPITIWILTILWRIYDGGIQRISRKTLVVTGIVSGLLPVIHIHSFFVVSLISVYVCIVRFISGRRELQHWVWYFSPTSIIASCVYLFIFGGIPGGSMSFHIGSIGPSEFFPLLWFWFINTGIMCILIPVAFIKSSVKIRIFYIPFMFLFFITNVVNFQHDQWDNRKFLLYWYLASCGLVGNYLYTLLRAKQFLIVGILFYLAIASGFIDVVNLFQFDKQKIKMFSSDDMKFAQIVRSKTQQDAVFLTAPSNTYFGVTGGRQIVMGWDVWLTNYGHSTQERMNDIKIIYSGNDSAVEKIKKYSVDYIVAGPVERAMYTINESFFERIGSVFLKNEKNTIYDVSHAK